MSFPKIAAYLHEWLGYWEQGKSNVDFPVMQGSYGHNCTTSPKKGVGFITFDQANLGLGSREEMEKAVTLVML
jgi:hypothetical protein